jgi:hypothetical protein
MSRPRFDNLNDVTAKFVGTICYYKDEPVYVKAAFHDDDDPKLFRLSVARLGENSEIIDLHDPEFRYYGYNIGYSNGPGCATWWYRRPAKQYQQGLKAEQLRFFSETGLGQPKTGFQFNKTYINMLKNSYISIEEAKKLTRDGNTHSAAWHRDFAISWSPVNSLYLLDYRASQIGTFGAYTPIDLFPQAEYLKETLHEALA